MDWIWVLIPLTALSIPVIAIISSVVEKYIKAQERQANLLTEEFIAEMTALKDVSEVQNRKYEQRIANLEAIVTAMAKQNQQTRALLTADQQYVMPRLQEQKDLSTDEKVAVMVEQLKE